MLSIQSRVWAAFGSVADETDFRAGLGVVRVPVGRLRLCRRQPRRGAGRRLPLLRVLGQRDRHRHARAARPPSSTTPAPRVVFAYLEGTPDARRLLDVGRKSLETGKPVMIWKAATTDAGIKAAASHTANMTGSYDLYRAALRQSGLIEVDDVEPIVDVAKLFAQGRLPKGNSVGVLSISGGSGIVYRRCRRARRPDAAAVLRPRRWPRCARSCRRSARRENPADITAGFFNDMTPVHRRAGDRAGRPAASTSSPSCSPRSPGAARRARRRGDRRRRRAHRQADPRRLVRPAGQVARGR